MNVLGISCFYHDSAACLVVDGEIVAAVAEERFTRQKHDNSFPVNSINYCLKEQNIDISELDKVVFYEKPIEKFDRILNTAADVFPRGYKFFSHALPEWLGTKMRIRKKLRKELNYKGKIEFNKHHRSHAASAFYPSPFEKAAVLTVDGVGEWSTNQLFYGDADGLKSIKKINYPDSLGLLYSTLTSYLGFRVNNGEYKVMGLAAYGEPRFQEEFRKLIEVNKDGSYRLDQEYFAYRYSQRMWSSNLEDLLGNPREEGGELTQRHKDIAATIQKITEDVLMRQVESLYSETDTENLCMAGGVALNSVANGRIRQEMPFDNIWIQPAAGDSGGAMGAALEGSSGKNNELENVYLGPEFSKERMREAVESNSLKYEELNKAQLIEEAAQRIADGQVIALYQGRSEWGPRALGNRSILADPSSSEVKEKVNNKIKFREEFRPFAPTVLQEYASEYFAIEGESPHMLFVHSVKDDNCLEIPSVTHVNNTSRIQTLKADENQFYYDLIDQFRQKTGIPLLLNTSFNLKGMPIVNTPEEAAGCFKKSGLDAIVTKNFVITK